jgi:soluble lytic murein transglycosylase
MDFRRTSLKVSTAALLTAPILLTPFASTNHYGSLAQRLAMYRSPMISTGSLDHAMQTLMGRFAPSKDPAGTVLASVSPTASLPTASLRREELARVPSSVVKPSSAEPLFTSAIAPKPIAADIPASAMSTVDMVTSPSILAPTRVENVAAPLVAHGPADALAAIASLGATGTSDLGTPTDATAYAPQPELLASVSTSIAPDPAAQLGVNLAGLREAVAFYKAGELANGDRIAASAPDPLVRTTLEWVALRTNQRETGFKRITKFLDAHPGWPSGPWLRKRAEEALFTDNPSPARVKEYFAGVKPLTVPGKLALARVLLAEGQKAPAADLVRSVWRDSELTQWQEGSIKKTFGELLDKADYKYRADRLLYKEDGSAALRSAQSAGSDIVLLAKARIAVINEGASDKEMAAVPASLQNDPGYVFSKIQKLRRADKIDEAAQMMLAAPRDPALLINPDQWWTERRLVARKLLDKGDAKTAYRICDEHSAQKSEARIEAEFHAGWIALRFLDDPEAAARHFAIAAIVAETPMSVARVAYWQGRTAEAAAKTAEAGEFYRKAANHSTTFYGQLARAKLGITADLVRATPPAAEGNQRDEVVRTIELLYAIGEKQTALPLISESAQRLEGKDQMAALARIVAKDRDARVSLQFGKLASQRGMALDDLAYPAYGIPGYQPLGNSAGRSVVYAIARQESAFDSRALSSAGAKGLMQMIASTAKRTASHMGVGFNEKRLLEDASFNAQLGAAHLGELLAEQRNSYVLTFAAYNAGGKRVKEWIDAYGDPRNPSVDPVDWVERIPFSETRNYVQRVMENLTVYRARFQEAGPAPLQTDLRQVAAKL